MIPIQLDLEPGEVAYFEVAGRRYAIACAREDSDDFPQLTDSSGQLALLSRDPIAQEFASSLQIRQLGDYCRGAFDRGILLGWGRTRECAEEVLANYLEGRAEYQRMGRNGAVKETSKYIWPHERHLLPAGQPGERVRTQREADYWHVSVDGEIVIATPNRQEAEDWATRCRRTLERRRKKMLCTR